MACGDPAGQSEDGHRRGLHRGRRSRAGAVPVRQGSTALAIDARKNLDSLTTLIDQSGRCWTPRPTPRTRSRRGRRNLATVTEQLQSQDNAVAGILEKGPGAADEVRALFDRLQPTLPIVLANLVSVGEVAVTYQPSLEQLLVLLPQGTATTQAIGVAKRNTKQDYMGDYLTLQPQPQPAAAMHHRLPAAPAAARAELRGLSRPARGRLVLPRPAGRAVQRARRPQHALRDRARQTRADGEDVREQRELRAAQRRLQLEGRPQRHAVGTSRSAAAAGLTTCGSASSTGSGAASASGRRVRPGDRHVRWTGRTCVHASRTWPAAPQRSKHGRRCCCPRRGTERGGPERSRRPRPSTSEGEAEDAEPRTGRRRLGRGRRGRGRKRKLRREPPPMSHVRDRLDLGLVAVLALGGSDRLAGLPRLRIAQAAQSATCSSRSVARAR